MKRRDFIRNMTLASVGAPLLLKELKLQSIGKQLFTVGKSGEDRVLVIIRMNGGNDGLHTVIPRDQYSNLMIQRSNIILPENDILALTDEVGLHPEMTGMETLFNEGKLGIVQNVGYPEQNRSHFRSMDIWSSGLIEEPATRGWLGRQFDNDYPNYPDDYPNSDHPDPFAISMGYNVSATCQGLMANFSHAVNDPFETYSLAASNAGSDGSYYGNHIEYISTLIDQANAYGSQINDAANAGNTLSTLYDETNPLAVQLRDVARMIHGGLQTKVYILNIDGFDTHDAQVSGTDVTTGTHAQLLKRVSDAIHAFQDDLALLDLEDRVAGMTFSEFGRQVASNASLGTDHGDAAPLFLFGACQNANIIGPNPVIGDTIIPQDGVPMQIDFRDVYASVLKDWFGVSETEIQGLFEHSVTFYPLLGGCGSVHVDEVEAAKNTQAFVYPNPLYNQGKVRFASLNEWVKIDLYDLQQRHVKTIHDGIVEQGQHDIPFELTNVSTGEYMIRIQKESGGLVTKLMKLQ